MEKTPIERIKFLLGNYWPDDRRWATTIEESFGGTSVHMTIHSKDYMDTYARINVVPKVNAPGYNLEVSYPGVCGSFEALVENMAVITTLAGFLKQIQPANVLKGE